MALVRVNTHVYVLQMTRFSKNEWIDFGLKVLKAEGYAQLKAGALAKRMQVSRGSFYWHFDNLADYHAALVTRWADQSNRATMALEPLSDPREKLLALVNAAQHSDFELEQAFRAWAREQSDIARQVSELDDMRLATVTVIVGKIVGDTSRSDAIAKFIYSAAIGLSVLGTKNVGIASQELGQLIDRLLERGR